MYCHLKRQLILCLTALLLCACPEVETTQFELCSLQITLDTTTTAPNETVLATGGPFTDVYDTVVEVGGHDAQVLSVEQRDCDTCDLCLVAAECNGCEPCDSCSEMCLDCVHQLSFVVPELEPSLTTVNVINRYGYGQASLDVATSEEEEDDGT